MKNNILEVVVSLLLIGLAVTILNPMHVWMPDMAHEAVLLALLALFAAFAAFVLREQATDEREVMLRALGGRIGYLVAALMLVVGIALEALHGTPDPWLIFTLLSMLIAKLGVRLYKDFF